MLLILGKKKYEYIIEQGYMLAEMDDKDKTEKNIIKGCQSTVWLTTQMNDGKLYLQADSNSSITKGIISILIDILSGNPPNEIIDYQLDEFISKSKLKEHLSPSRANGLMLMIEKIRFYATISMIKKK